MLTEDQSYKEYLNKLPAHKAPREVWERLESSLFAIDASLLHVHQAPAGVWNRIEKSYLFRRNLYRWSLALIIFFSLLIPGYHLYKNQYQQKKDQIPGPITNEEMPSTINKIKQEPFYMVSIQHHGIDLETYITLKADHQIAPPEIIAVSKDKSFGEIAHLPAIKAELLLDLDYVVSPRDKVDDCSPFTATSEFIYGLSYEYQHFLSGDSYLETMQDYWHSFSVNGRLCFDKFYLESGIGISLSKDETSWSYDYLQNVLINTYEYVDSIHYDPNTGETIYYTSIVEVYDSIPYSRSGTVNRKNNYLRIPVLAGVNLFQRKNFSTSLSGGFIYSLLLSNNETKITYNEPESRITSVYYQETKRIQHCFNLTLRLNFEWQLNRKFIFYAFPSCNYYLNHLYEGQDGGNPLSVGFGVGIFIK